MGAENADLCLLLCLSHTECTILFSHESIFLQTFVWWQKLKLCCCGFSLANLFAADLNWQVFGEDTCLQGERNIAVLYLKM